jgi:hypothetical protein
MNDDALLQVTSGFSKLSRASLANPEIGLISSTSNLVGNVRQNPQVSSNGNVRLEPRMVCFVCVYIPRATIQKVGLLDPIFTEYGFQDDDYCLRVRQAGLKIGIFDGCFVDHSRLRSTYRGKPSNPGNLIPGAKIFEAKWGNCLGNF